MPSQQNAVIDAAMQVTGVIRGRSSQLMKRIVCPTEDDAERTLRQACDEYNADDASHFNVEVAVVHDFKVDDEGKYLVNLGINLTPRTLN